MPNPEDRLDEEIDFGPDDHIETIQPTEPDSTFSIFDNEIVKDTNEESLLNDILKARGIENSMVKIIDENEEEKEVNFYDLTRDEQLEILNTQSEITNDELDDSEIDFLNYMRTNNMTPQEFLEKYKESVIAEMQNNQTPLYEIDAYDDHELFLLDLKNKFDLTDEELQKELEKELANEELFTKKVTKIREEYKQLEDQYNASKQQDFENQRAEQYNQFANAMVNIATNTSEYHGIVLEDNEKAETLSYLLDLDENGMSQFSKDLNDPNRLYEAAWYLRYGKEAFEALENAYEAEIAKLKKDKPKVVVRNSDKPIANINDLY